jgi:hypothetical protein
MENPPTNRRSWLKLAATSSLIPIVGCDNKPATVSAPGPTVDPLRDHLALGVQWGPAEMWNFLKALGPERQELIKSSFNGELSQFDASAIQKVLFTYSSNVFERPFGDEYAVNYHSELLKGIAGKMDIGEFVVNTQSSFRIERLILQAAFTKIWDSLEVSKRTEILSTRLKGVLNSEGKAFDISTIAALSGSACILTLSGMVSLAGFAFYTTMSTMICAAAGFFGITLPFAAYAGASTATALLAGPVGWAIAGILATIGIAILGMAKPERAIAYVCQVHLIKVQALSNLGHDMELIQAV